MEATSARKVEILGGCDALPDPVGRRRGEGTPPYHKKSPTDFGVRVPLAASVRSKMLFVYMLVYCCIYMYAVCVCV